METKLGKQEVYIGIDLGGTYIKGGVVDGQGNILIKDSTDSESEKGYQTVVGNICNLIKKLAGAVSGRELCKTVGIGIPGMIDTKNGVVTYSNNLHWKEVYIRSMIKEQTGFDVECENDANVAALGEASFGAGKDYLDSVMITLGTGVGGGVVLGGKLFDAGRPHAELGHVIIRQGGELCTCGRHGCFEVYSSATGLVRETKNAMLKNKHSKMWDKYTSENVSGKTAFEFMESDETAKQVVNDYIENLSEGIVNVVNIFRPNVIILGGGVCKEGDRLTLPLQKLVDQKIYGGSLGNQTKIVTATLGNDAGFLGAAKIVIED